MIGQKALGEIYARLRRQSLGNHAIPEEGRFGERLEQTKPYEFGDPFHLHMSRTIRNAMDREGPGTPVRLKPDDFEIYRSELITSSATAMLVDLSWSMGLRGSFQAAKKVAMALHNLITSQYPKDSFYIIGFAAYAKELKPVDLPQLQWDEYVLGTNMQHALLLAERLLAKHNSGTKQIIMISDGEPAAHLENGHAQFAYPPTPETIRATMRAVRLCTQKNIAINTFMLDANYYLKAFMDQIAKINGGRVFYTSPEKLGEYILVDYVQHKRKRLARRAWVRVGIVGVLLLLAACQESPKDPVEVARAAIESAPTDPSPRVALARLYLERGRGDLAEVLIDQAIERGKDRLELMPERAEALRIAGKTAELMALPIPDESIGRAKVLATRAKAEPSDAAYKAVYAALDAVDLPALRAQIDAEPAAARARAHHDCAKVPSPTAYTWENRIVTSDQSDATPGPVVRVTTVQELEQAAKGAPDSATIEIEAKDYRGAVAEWRQNNLTVRGVGGRPHITAFGKSVQNRDAWLFSGNDVTVENVEISGAHSRQDKNGASIRFIGRNLTLRHVYLHDSEDGVLTGNGHPDSKILIEYSEFARNGDGEGYAHNLYIGVSADVMFRFNYSHESNIGHLFKSRAARTVVAYNYLADHDAGTSSRSIDIPDGGQALVIGNVIDHGAGSVNKTIIGYGTENERYDVNSLQVVNNTFYNRYLNAIAVANSRPTVAAQVVNNLFAGAPLVRLDGAGDLAGNVDRVDHGLANPRDGDYSITESSPAVDAGIDSSTLGIDSPAFEYVHPVSVRLRVRVWNVDVGAYERCGF